MKIHLTTSWIPGSPPKYACGRKENNNPKFLCSMFPERVTCEACKNTKLFKEMAK